VNDVTPADVSPADVAQTADVAETAQRLSLAITRLRSRLREEAGVLGTDLSVSQLAVLHQVLTDGPVTAAGLAVALHVTPQAIAQNLAALKAAGLVLTERDPGDRRKTLITATAAARRLYTSLRASKQSYLIRAIATHIAPHERADLNRAIELLERLAAAHPGSQSSEKEST
jgi:DNA-binding MarR family transcriptional regulator